MAVNDVYQKAPTSVANGATLDLRPTGTNEVSIHNIFGTQAFEVYYTDGTNPILIDSFPGADSMRGERLHSTNANWIQVKNVSGGASGFFGADGFQTKT